MEVRPMERDRTRDSIEQLEDTQLPNPITNPVAELTRPGKGFEPGIGDEPDDPEEEGPPGHTSQMAR